MQGQRHLVMGDLLTTEMADGGPPPLATRTTTAAHPEVQMQAWALQAARRELAVPQLLEQHKWDEIESYYNSIVQRYRAQNGADRVDIKPGMTPQEMMQAALQFEPVRVDPNEIATMRQRIVALDRDMKAQTGLSVYSDPRTSRVANLLGREAGSPLGFVQSQPVDILKQMPWYERALMPVRETAEAGADWIMQAVTPPVQSVLERLGYQSLDSFTHGDAAAYYNQPTSWAQDRDGSWYHNGGKVGAAEGIAALWYGLTGQLIDQKMAESEDARAQAKMRASGIDSLAMTTGHFLGSLVPMAALTGPFVKVGASLVTKGVAWLATGGRVASLGRAAAITQMLGGAAGYSAFESMSRGHIEGYGAAFLNSMPGGLAMMALGAMGKGVERLLSRTETMPEAMARGLSGAAEGMGFAAIDPHTWNLVWSFLKNPNPQTRGDLFEQVASQAIGMALMKGFGGRTPGEQALEQGAKMATTEEGTRVAAEAGIQPAAMARYQQLLNQHEVLAGKNPEAARATLEQAGEAEGEVRAQQTGLDRTNLERLQARQEVRQRLHDIGQMPEGPERYAATERLLRGEPEPTKAGPEAGTEAGGQAGPNEGAAAANDLLAKMPKKVAGYDLEIREMEPVHQEAGLGTHEWVVRDPETSRPIGYGTFRSDGRHVVIEDAEVRPEYRGKGIYSEILRSLADLHEGRISSRTQSADAKAAWEKAGLRPTEHVEGGEAGTITAPADEAAAKTEARRARFLEEGPDPLESPRMRDLPPDLRQAILDAPNARGRRQAVLEWRPKAEVTEPELQALGGGEAAPDILEQRAAPAARQAGTPASIRMRPQLEMEGVPGTPQVKESDILADMEGRPGDPVRTSIHYGIGIRGRFSTKGIAAWFHRFWNMIRLPKDQPGLHLVFAVHEWAHAMDEAMNPWRDLGDLTEQEHLGLIRAAHPWYPGLETAPPAVVLAESWAEFWARYLLDDPTLREDVGPFFDRAMRWLAKKPDLIAQMDRIQTGLRNWRDIGAPGRAQSIFRTIEDQESVQDLQARDVLSNTPAGKLAAGIRKVWRALRNQLRATAPLEQAEIDSLVRSGMTKAQARAALREVGPMADPARMLDILSGTSEGVANQIVTHGTIDFDTGTTNGESWEAIKKDVGAKNWRDFQTWMGAKHSIEIAQRGKLANAPIDDFVHAAEKIEQAHPEFLGYADRLRSFFDRVFQYAVDGGLFTQEQVNKFRHVGENGEGDPGYRFYIPFDRVTQDRGIEWTRFEQFRGPQQGSSVGFQTGSTTQQVEDSRLTIPRNVARIVADVHRTMAMKSLLMHGLTFKGSAGFVTEIARDRVPYNTTMAEIAKSLLGEKDPSKQAIGNLIEQLINSRSDLGGAVQLWSMEKAPKDHRPIVAFTPRFTADDIARLPTTEAQQIARDMDGKTLWLEMDKDVFETMRNLAVRPTAIDALPYFLGHALKVPTAIKRAGGVPLNLAFALRNIIVDPVNRFVLSEKSMPLGPLQAFGESVAGMLKLGTENAEVWRNMGGGHGTTQAATEMAASFGGVSGRPGFAGQAMDFVRRALHVLTMPASVTEQGSRFAEFESVLRRAEAEGSSPLERNLLALEASKNITGAFHRGGTALRAINQIVAFFKAPLNVGEQYARLLSGKEGGDKQARAMIRGLAGLSVTSAVLWWLNKDEKWYQDLTPQDRVNNWWLKLPGVDQPLSIPKREAGTLFGSAMEEVLSQAYEKDPVGIRDFVEQFTSAFLPNTWNGLPVPDFAQPLVEWGTNRTMYSGRPIVPDWMQEQRVPADQAMPYTHAYAIELGRFLGMSPAKIDQFIDTATGGTVGRFWDIGADVATGGGALTQEGLSASNLPIVGRAFFRPTHSRALDELYSLHTDLVQRHGSHVADEHAEQARVLVGNAITQIGRLHKAAGTGQLSMQAAHDQAVELARQVLQQVRQ